MLGHSQEEPNADECLILSRKHRSVLSLYSNTACSRFTWCSHFCTISDMATKDVPLIAVYKAALKGPDFTLLACNAEVDSFKNGIGIGVQTS